MPKTYRVADADGHVNEPVDLWLTRLDPTLRSRAPKFEGPGIAFHYQGHHYPNIPNYPESLRKAIEDHQSVKSAQYYKDLGMDRGAQWTPDVQVKGMDKLGIDVAYLYPTRGLQAWAIDAMDPQLASAMARAYNDWVYEFSSYAPDRLRPTAGLALQDPIGAVEELKRVAGLGIRRIFLRPNPVNDRTFADPAYEPLWEECEKSGIAIGVHEGGYTLLQAAGADRFKRRFSLHACSHPMEHMMAFLALIEGGVLERHPGLKFAFLESGCGWVPYWLWRLDFEYENLSPELGENATMKPSDYFRRQCYIAFEPDEPYLKAVVDFLGEDRLLFASDFPHASDHGVEIVDEALALEGILTKATLKKILWDNPMAFYQEG